MSCVYLGAKNRHPFPTGTGDDGLVCGRRLLPIRHGNHLAISKCRVATILNTEAAVSKFFEVHAWSTTLLPDVATRLAVVDVHVELDQLAEPMNHPGPRIHPVP